MSDCGHGWVHPRADGAKARCGGPAVCSLCAIDAAAAVSVCPYCGEQAVDARAEIAHMEAKHPDVIAQRRAEAGIKPPPEGDRLRALARDWDFYERQVIDAETRDQMQRAVLVELRVELARLAGLLGVQPPKPSLYTALATPAETAATREKGT